MLPDGYGSLLDSVSAGLDIRFRHVVERIERCEHGVNVHISRPGGANRPSATEYEQVALYADAVLITVPLGVLKTGSITFSPPLPPRKQGAIDRLGFGALNKVRQASTNLLVQHL